MPETTGIEWTDSTFNPWIGCEKISPACAHCYAATLAKNRMGLDVWGDPDTTERRVTTASWKNPRKWNRDAEREQRPRLVFCASLADVFEEHPALPEPRARLWELIVDTPWLTWQLLTKRPENIAAMVPAEWAESGCPPNVWLGTSVENARFTHRALQLIEVEAAVHFLSCEPLLGSLFPPERRWCKTCGGTRTRPTDGYHRSAGTSDVEVCEEGAHPLLLHDIEWVIGGGESGPGWRTTDPAWARELRDAAGREGVPFFWKQNGGATPKANGKDLDGSQHCAIPEPHHPGLVLA